MGVFCEHKSSFNSLARSQIKNSTHKPKFECNLVDVLEYSYALLSNVFT